MEKLQKIKLSVPFQRIDLATDYIQLNQRYLADFSTPEKRFTNQIRTFARMKQRTEEDYYIESRRLREETMRMADELKDHPMRFIVTNVITMDVEITKSDLKTIVSKNTQNNRFNAFKNKVAQDIRGFLEKSKYEGWREVIPGKHPETAYFAYFSRKLGEKAYLCVRKIKNTGLYKPYAIIDQKMFDAEIGKIKK
ncbi:MAG: hypothetical protein J6E29_03335 [Prevotella sp.]|nr:hypothetical protein [Prevotella sp.]